MICWFAPGGRAASELKLPAIVFMALAACAQRPPASEPSETPAEPESVQWIEQALPEPVAVAETPLPTRDDLIVVVPKPDGSAGSVVVYQGERSIVLETAWSAARIDGAASVTTFTADAAQVGEEFGTTRGALPARPHRFTVYFQEGSDQLTADSEAEIGNIMADLAARAAPEIVVIGHTDTVGKLEFNDKLSLQRAERVRAVLVDRGMSPAFLSVAGRGERELLVATDDETPEEKNLRVEISVR